MLLGVGETGRKELGGGVNRSTGYCRRIPNPQTCGTSSVEWNGLVSALDIDGYRCLLPAVAQSGATWVGYLPVFTVCVNRKLWLAVAT